MQQDDAPLSQRIRFGFLRGGAARPRRSRRRAEVELLEDRRLLAAQLNITAGTLSFAAIGSAMDLTVSVDSGGTYTFRDPSQTITLGGGAGGWTVSPDGHTATGPASSFTQIGIVGDPGSFNDQVTILSTNAPANISTGAGNDVFTFHAGAIAAAVTLTNPLSGGSDGDTVHFETGGVPGSLSTGALGRESYQADGRGLIDVTSVKPNFSDSFAGLSPSAATLSINLNSLFPTPTALSTTLSASGGQVNVAVAGLPTRQFPEGSIAGFVVGGTTAGNALVVDYAGGVPYGPELSFAPPAPAGGAQNVLTLKDGGFSQEAVLASGPGAGSIAFPNRVVGGSTITNKINFERVNGIVDTVPVDGLTFTAASGAQTVGLATGPTVSGVQTTRISDVGTNHFAPIDFANKTALAINTGNGDDVINLNLATPAAGLQAVAVNSGAGDDAIALPALPAGLSARLDAGAGAGNIIDLSGGGSVAGIQGPVAVLSTGGAYALRIDDSSSVAPLSFVVTPTQIGGGRLGSAVDYSGPGAATVEIRGGSANDLFTFQNFGGPTKAVAYEVTGGPGVDRIVVDSTIPNVDFATPGVLNFGPGQPPIRYAEIEQIALNVAAAPPVGVPVTLTTMEAQPFVQQTVARFTDAAPSGTVSYLASIDWGDGSPASGGVVVPAGVTGGYEILGNHRYAAAATYPLTVTLTRRGGASSGTTVVGGTTITVNGGGETSITINSAAVVEAAPLTAAGAPITGRAMGTLTPSPGETGARVAWFVDAGTNRPPSGYSAVIDWGDGTPPTPATRITAVGAPGGVVYSVFGEHSYANIGTYTVTVHIVKPPAAVAPPAIPQAPPGALAVAVSTATILPPAPSGVTGQLDPASDSGASHSDGITHVVQPRYFGLTDSPGATVAVLAAPVGGGMPILLGAAQADNAGAWSVQSTTALPDGAYTITVFAADQFDGAMAVSTTLAQTLVIDTVGPKIMGAAFTPKEGFVGVQYQDFGGPSNAGSGMNLATVQDPSNYAFAFVSSPVRGYRPPSRWLVGPIGVDPGTAVGPQTARVVLNGGAAIRGGVYMIRIRSAASDAPSGVQDIAGNALDGEFYGTFPTGNNVPGGDFAAMLDAIHGRVFAPQSTVGPGRPNPPRPNPPRPAPPVRPRPVPPVRPRPAPPVRPRPIPRPQPAPRALLAQRPPIARPNAPGR